MCSKILALLQRKLSSPLELEEIANTCHETFGPIFRIWVSIIPFFLVMHPRHLQHILGSRKQSDKNFFYTLMHNFIGEGLITNSGEITNRTKSQNRETAFLPGYKWKLHRKLIQPCFHTNILETFLETFQKCASKLVVQTDSNIKITPLVNNLVLDILHRR